jgi:TM2 domain-containing membrane protein YozV
LEAFVVKALAILLNILIPGVGSFVIGAVGQGIGQILIYGIGFLLTFGTLGFGGIIGLPMMLGAWVWGIVTAAGASPQPLQVNITNSNSSGADSPPVNSEARPPSIDQRRD